MKNQRLIIVLAMLCLAISMNAKEKKPSPGGNKNSWSTDSIKCQYNGWAMTSNFNMPIIRYNIESLKANRDRLGNIEYFNSLGAGFGITYGRIKIKSQDTVKLRNKLTDEVDIQMKNIIGLNIGFLFSKSGDELNSRTIFAPTICLQFLDFQFGYGYELGDVANTAHRSFFTVSYGISINKLTDAGSYLLTRPQYSDLKGNSQKINFNGFF